MGVAFHFGSTISIPVLPGHPLDIVINVKLSPRFATYMFVIATVVSVLVAEFHVMIHRHAKEWEEDRREYEHIVNEGQEQEEGEEADMPNRSHTPFMSVGRQRSSSNLQYTEVGWIVVVFKLF